MREVLLFLCGVAGGVLGGLGLGGGTLMIPLLTLGMGVATPLAAELNLLAFIPMSLAALIFHGKKGLVEGKKALFLSLFAMSGALAAALLSERVPSEFSGRGFGWFLIGIGAFSAFADLVGFVRKKKKK